MDAEAIAALAMRFLSPAFSWQELGETAWSAGARIALRPRDAALDGVELELRDGAAFALHVELAAAAAVDLAALTDRLGPAGELARASPADPIRLEFQLTAPEHQVRRRRADARDDDRVTAAPPAAVDPEPVPTPSTGS